MEENNNKSLDQFFKNRINQSTKKPEDWNNPDDSIFGRAMDKVDAERKRRRRFGFIWFAGFALLAGVITFATFQSTGNNQDGEDQQKSIFVSSSTEDQMASNIFDRLSAEEKESKNSDLNHLQTGSSTLFPSDPQSSGPMAKADEDKTAASTPSFQFASLPIRSKNPIEVQTDQRSAEDITDVFLKKSGTFAEKIKFSEPLAQVQGKAQGRNQGTATKGENIGKQPNAVIGSKENNVGIRDQKPGKNKVVDSKVAGGPLLEDFDTKPKAENPDKPTDTQKQSATKGAAAGSTAQNSNISETQPAFAQPNSKLKLSLQSHLLLGSMYMTSPEPLGDELRRYDNWYPGLETKLLLEHSLQNNWQVHYGINIARVRNESTFNSESQYNEDFESSTGSQVQYRTSFLFGSPFKSSEEEMAFGVDTNTTSSLDKISSEAKIQNRFTWMGIAAGFNYRFFAQKRFDIKAGLELGYNRIVKASENRDLQLYLQGDMVQQKVVDEEIKAVLKPSFWTGALNLSLDYQLKGNWQLSFNTGYLNSLSSMRTMQAPAETKTHFRGMRLGLGLSKQF